MGLINPSEWRAWIRSLKQRPHLAIAYSLDLGFLLLRRVRQTIQLRMGGSLHRGVKVWPTWLSDRTLPPSPKLASLSFPVYPGLAARRLLDVAPILASDDPEFAFAQHRWSDCLVATLDPERTECALAQIKHWIENPPSRVDIAWETYSCCERVVNLAVLLATRPELLNQLNTASVQSLLEDALHWINSRLEYYGETRTNNHILNNARALIVLGSVLNNHAAIERGLIIFRRMSKQLFQPGGFLRERSSHYQVVVTNWVLDAAQFAGAVQALPPEVCRLLDDLKALALQVAKASAWLVDCHGGLVDHIGDISPDTTPLISLLRLQSLYPHALTNQTLGQVNQIDDWIGVRLADDTLLACVPNPTFPLAYATHGHADLGSFVWRRAGCTFLADAGRGSYANNSATREQISAFGHNTVMVDGLPPLSESLLRTGIWLPVPYAEAHIKVSVHQQGFHIAHDGFARGGKVRQHQRRVSLDHVGLCVIDDFHGEGSALIDLFWHFSPECASNSEQRVLHLGDLSLTQNSDSAEGKVTRAWGKYMYAHAYGMEQAAVMLHEQWQVILPCSIQTVFEVSPCVA